MNSTALFGLGILLIFVNTASASFENNRLRDLSPFDIIELIKDRFPMQSYEKIVNPKISDCIKISPKNLNAIGAASPLSGAPVQNHPQTVFLNWYFECLDIVSTEYFNLIKLKSEINELSGFLPNEMILKFQTFGVAVKTSWKELSLIEKEKIINFQLYKSIGPEPVLQDVKSNDDFSAKTKKIILVIDKREPESLLETLRWIAVLTMMQPECLRY